MSATRSIIFGGAALLGLVGSAWALDPTLHVSQYGHTSWRIQGGVFSGVPISVAQTSDGYLWIGTQTGLVRFDGVRFVPFVPPETEAYFNPQIVSLLGGADGALWIGTSTGFFQWKDNALTPIKASRSRIEAIREDSTGVVWVVRGRTSGKGGGPLCEVVGAALRCYGENDGIPAQNAQALTIDDMENIWIGNGTTLTRWHRNAPPSSYSLPELRGQENLIGISTLNSRPDGSIIVGMRFGGGLGLQTFFQGQWRPFTLPGFNGGALDVSSILRDREGTLWVGTDDTGLYRIANNQVDHFAVSGGLSGDTVYGMYEDREGDLWVVTSNGMDRFRDVRVASVGKQEGLSLDDVNSVTAAHDGTIWLGNSISLDSLHNDAVSAITGARLPGKHVTSLLEDHLGRLWVGIDNQLFVLAGGKFNRIKKRDGSPAGAVVSITEDSEENIWAYVLPRAMLRIKDEVVQEEIPEAKIPFVISMAADSRGGIWLALPESRLGRYFHGQLEIIQFEQSLAPGDLINLVTSADGSVLVAAARGLVVWRNGTLRMLSTKNGLPCDRINSLVSDHLENLWLYMQCGLVRISHADLEEMWKRPDVTVKPLIFDALDGVHPGRGPFQPSATLSPDGRVWFANENAVQVIDPAHISANKVPPPVHIEQVIADRKTYSIGPDLKLPALTRDLEIDYTALSLAIPEKVRFRYKLDGHDKTWEDPGSRRQAFYTDLRPGNYQFHVIAANNDGVWNETGAALDIAIAPAFYQTSWFYAACALAGVAILWQLYQMRVRLLARQIRVRMGERVEERERIARELHDTLLQSTQGLLFIFRAFWIRLSEADPMREKLGSALDRANDVIAEARDRVRELRSTDILDSNLESAFAKAGRELLGGGTATFRAQVKGTPRPLQPAASNDIYRIGREALQNAAAHSSARSIEIEIIYEANELQVRIRDDGSGIDPNVLSAGSRDGHFGLVGMRERAQRLGGRLEIWSKPGAGAEIALMVPADVAYQKTEKLTGWRRLFAGLPSTSEDDASLS